MRAFNLALVGGGIALFAGTAFIYAASGGSPPADADLSLSEFSLNTSEPAYSRDTSRLRFAVAAVLSPRATLENYEALALYIEERLGLPVEMVVGKSYAEINALVRSGEVSVALVCSGAYVAGESDFGMQILAIPKVNGATTYHSYLIVPSDSDARTWEGLRGATFAFTDPLSNSGRLVPLHVLDEMGETPDTFFRHVIFTYAHDKSVSAVADKLVEGASVDSLVYDLAVREDPTVASKTRVIWRSPPYGINPVVVHPNIDPLLRVQLESILLDMHEDPEGQRVLERIGIDSFVHSGAATYDTIRDMIAATARR